MERTSVWLNQAVCLPSIYMPSLLASLLIKPKCFVEGFVSGGCPVGRSHFTRVGCTRGCD